MLLNVIMRTVSTPAFSTKEQWLQKFFRFGLISKGVVYCLLGLLTVMAAIGLSTDKASKKDAFNFIYAQPFGKVLLALVAIGLIGFVTLRLFQSIKDIGHHGSDAKGIVTRIGYGISALLYSSLAIYALKILNRSDSEGGDTQQFIVGKVLQLGGGEWIIGITAIIVVISGGYQIYKGASLKFTKKIKLSTSRFTEVFRKAGMIGYISRGIVLLIIGYFLFHAAVDSNAGEVQDTDGAFTFLENSFGSLMMGIVALGLTAYGVFMFVKAKYESLTL
jgi:hypothetical protein